MTRPTLISNIPGKRLGATALAALGWLSAFAVLWLWALELMAIYNAAAIALLSFSLAVAVMASSVATGR